MHPTSFLPVALGVRVTIFIRRAIMQSICVAFSLPFHLRHRSAVVVFSIIREVPLATHPHVCTIRFFCISSSHFSFWRAIDRVDIRFRKHAWGGAGRGAAGLSVRLSFCLFGARIIMNRTFCHCLTGCLPLVAS